MEKKLTTVKLTELEENEAYIPIEELCRRLDLKIIHKGSADKVHFTTFNINRPGLQLAGFYEHFGGERVQVIGELEISYLSKLSAEAREKAVDGFFSHYFPCVVFSSGLIPSKEIMEAAKKYDRVILGSAFRSTMIINELSIYLNEVLAPKTTVHGGLMDIYGVGVLIIGKSSVGKSETALELLQRMHRLVADDAVCIKRISDKLVGTSPSVIRYFMEVRGVGLIDVRSMYGAGSVLQSKEIDLVVKLEEYDGNKEYNRLGDGRETYNILEVELPMLTIPVKTGRNLAVILEVAARNYRLKSMGYDALKELEERSRARKEED